MGNSKSVETVKAESFQQESIRDDSMSLVNLHLPSSFGGGMVIIVLPGARLSGVWGSKTPGQEEGYSQEGINTIGDCQDVTGLEKKPSVGGSRLSQEGRH